MVRFTDSLGSSLRVRVTPGVNRPLAQLNPGFRYLHWPGFISRTHPFGLAAYCVSYPAGTLCFQKPVLFFTRGYLRLVRGIREIVNSRDPLVIATCEPCFSQGTQAPLLANVRGCFQLGPVGSDWDPDRL